jgi:hypothetical protein
VVVPTVSGTPSWITFDFSSWNIEVYPNEVLAFQPIVSGSNGQVVGEALAFGADPDPYTRGELFYKQAPCSPPVTCPPPTGGNWDPFIDMVSGQNLNYADMTFTTTVSEVPTPATLPLFATGLVLMALLAWRKRPLRPA